MVAAALCSGGLEKILSNEIRKLAEHTGHDYKIIDSGFGKVRFETGLAGLYGALFSLRTADRLMLEAASFPASDFDGLFEGTRSVAWEDYIPKGMGLTVDKARSNHSRLAAETSIQAVVNKAAAERLCGIYHQNRLSEDPGNAASIRVHIEKDKVYLMLDICGDPLYKRGYRVSGGTAPLRESVAAALLLQSLWRRKYPLYDPFCGSGTIVIEAALYAWNAAPGLGRRFAVSNLAFGDAVIENEMREALFGKIDVSRQVEIYGSDGDSAVVSAAKANLERAFTVILRGGTQAACRPKLWWRKMEEAKAPSGEGFIITNPPYGIRLLDKESAEETYRSMAALKNNFPSWKINVLSASSGFETFFGENASRCKKIVSGAFETFFYEYDAEPKKKTGYHHSVKSAVNKNKDTSGAAKKTSRGMTYTW
ncbi:MAG: class I SAM-dependent RNA methyltransferase [Spirochaetaceae bacterium]|jgi:putative N6-adenine-specific DNA methylase|nr:class I SAM-dependent RNA methyltransferase [Spirochaetaceae bacterium]